MKKTFIILIAVADNNDARKQCEAIENSIFHAFGKYPDSNVHAKMIHKALKMKFELDDAEIIVYPISDFMDACNNDDITTENYFMSYVTVES